MRHVRFIEDLLKDIQFGLRQLRHNPGFVVIAVITLALGIGANTAIFSFIDAVIIRPLPYPHPEELVGLSESRIQKSGGYIQAGVSPLNIIDIQHENHVFQEVGYYQWDEFALTQTNPPERLDGVRTSANLLNLLGIQPTLGRSFRPQEAETGHDQVAILSYRLWQRRFGEQRSVIGRTIQLNDRSYTVIGVMPRNFYFVGDFEVDVITPLAFTASDLRTPARTNRSLQTLVRLKRGIGRAEAQAQMSTLANQLATQYPEANKGWGLKVEPLHSAYDRVIAKPLVAIVIAVFFVFLIACVNVANLLLARSTARRREIAIRVTMGATRKRVMWQLLTESILLGIAGGAAGLLIAVIGIKLLAISCARYAPYPGVQWISLDGHVLAFCFAIAVIAGIIFGLAPAIHISKTNLNDALKEGGITATAEGSRRRLRNSLVVCEISLAIVLMMGAGLLIRSFVKMLNVPLGFDPDHVLAIYISLPRYKYQSGIQQNIFFSTLRERALNLPGVQGAAVGGAIPFGGYWDLVFLAPEGMPRPAPRQEPAAFLSSVSPGFFKTLKVPFLAGRDFTQADRPDSPPVLIINQTVAKHFWPGQDPIGKRLVLLSDIYAGRNSNIGRAYEVVGEIRDYKTIDLGENRSRIFVPFGQQPQTIAGLIVRSSVPPETLVPTLRQTVWSLDKQQPIGDVSTLRGLIGRFLGVYRFPMVIVWIFTSLALVLSAIGIFGVISYSVSQRTHEMAIRMALGAQRADVLKLIVGEGLRLTLIGVLIGVGVALALGRLVASFLYGVRASDPFTFIAVALVMALVALFAAYIPARRATKVDPMVALRCE